MKKIFSLFCLLFCFSTKAQHTETFIYQYKNPQSSVNVFADYFIVLEKNNDEFIGYFYGDTDLFEDVREGYIPAYFVKKMDKLVVDLLAKKISFEINVSNDDYLYGKYYNPISLTIRSTQEALQKGYTKWKSSIGKKMIQQYYGFLENTTLGDKETIFIYKNNDKQKMNFVHKIVPKGIHMDNITQQSFLKVNDK